MLHFFKLGAPFCLSVMFLSLILSPLPGAVAATASASRLTQMFQHPGLSAPHTGVHVLSLKTGQTLVDYHKSTALIPASNMKVLTSAAALTLLKPEFRFRTAVYAKAARQEVINGDVYLKGFGDPELNDERLNTLAEELKYLGIRQVKGNVIVDDSFFDQQLEGAGWKKTYGSAAYSAKISALSLNLNTVKVWVRPTSPGRPGQIELQPANDFFEVVNQTLTTQGRSTLKIVRTLTEGGKNRVVVSGHVSARVRPQAETINLDYPALYVGHAFKRMLQNAGIQVQGRVLQGQVSAGTPLLAETQSRPLNEIVAELNKHSVNLIAENLLKFMGATFEGAPGTAEKGAKVIRERFLEKEVGYRAPGLVIADGSGLSPLNRLTPELLTQVLAYMHKRYDVSVDFVSSLAVSGVDGTLRTRLNAPALKRRIRAKTGFINGVSSLSGYVYTDQGEVMVFSVLMNHYQNFGIARTLQDRLCTELVGYR